MPTIEQLVRNGRNDKISKSKSPSLGIGFNTLEKKYKDHPGLRDSLLIFWIAPVKHLAWDDDAAWARFAGNVGTLAWVGKSAGMKGYMVDMEDYTDIRQYFWDPKRDTMSYDEACKLARKRGAEIFQFWL